MSRSITVGRTEFKRWRIDKDDYANGDRAIFIRLGSLYVKFSRTARRKK